MDGSLPPKNHNAPPPLIEVDGLEQRLLAEWSHLFDRLSEFRDGVERWKALHFAQGTIAIADDADQGASGDFLAQIQDQIRMIDGDGNKASLRLQVKEPITAAGRIVDGLFKARLADPLRSLAAEIHGPMHAYAVAKRRAAEEAAAAERRRAQEEADKLAREAAIAAKAAAAANQEPDAVAAAAAAEEAAIAAEQRALEVPVASPKAADASRTYGALGSVSSLRTTWKVRITDASKLPREYLTPNMPVIEAAMKASRHRGGPPAITIPGVEFYVDEKLGNRR